MKLRETRLLISRDIEPSFPEMQLLRDRLVRCDGDPIVRGFAIERSHMHKDVVRLHVFAQPLFVPAESMYLGISQPLGEYCFDDTAVESELMGTMLRRAAREGRGFLERVSDCASLADTVLEMPGDRMDERLGAEIRAYCLLWNGRTGAAAAALDDVMSRLGEFEVEYELEALGRVTQVRQALVRSETEARGLLETWARQTKNALLGGG